MLDEIKVILGSPTSLYIGTYPSSPDAITALYRSGGLPRGLTASKMEQPTFQVRVRDSSYASGEARCDAIKDLLHNYVGGKFLLIQQDGDILSLGRDQNGRTEWSMNFSCKYVR